MYNFPNIAVGDKKTAIQVRLEDNMAILLKTVKVNESV